MPQPDIVETFAKAFERELASHSPETPPQRSGTPCVTLRIFGKKTSEIHDWFEARSTEMTRVIEAKWAALAEYNIASSERNLQILRAARSKAQQSTQ